jgi:hypothetical protein
MLDDGEGEHRAHIQPCDSTRTRAVERRARVGGRGGNIARARVQADRLTVRRGGGGGIRHGDVVIRVEARERHEFELLRLLLGADSRALAPALSMSRVDVTAYLDVLLIVGVELALAHGDGVGRVRDMRGSERWRWAASVYDEEEWWVTADGKPGSVPVSGSVRPSYKSAVWHLAQNAKSSPNTALPPEKVHAGRCRAGATRAYWCGGALRGVWRRAAELVFDFSVRLHPRFAFLT